MSKYQIVLLGSKQVGKTQILNQLRSVAHEHDYEPTIGADVKEITLGIHRFNCWDLSADYQLDQDQITSKLQNSHIICIVFDVNDQAWKQTLDTHMTNVMRCYPTYKETAKVFFIGNKADDSKRTSDIYLQVQAYARNNNGKYVEVSAMHAKGFDELADQFLASVTNMTPIESSASKSKVRSNNPLVRGPNSRRRQSFSGHPLSEITEEGESASHKTGDLPPASGRSSKKKEKVGFTEVRSIQDAPRPNTPPSSSTHVRQQTLQTRDSSYYISVALRVAGIAIMLTGLVSIIYLIMLATSTIGTPMLTALMNHMVGNIGGLLGMSASSSIAAFSNTCAVVGVSAETATAILGAIHGVAMIGGGYKLFDTANKPSPAAENTTAAAPTTAPVAA